MSTLTPVALHCTRPPQIRSVWTPREAVVQQLPLVSCFNMGAGRGVWLEGRRVSTAPWGNMAAQDVVAATTPLQVGGGAGGREGGCSETSMRLWR